MHRAMAMSEGKHLHVQSGHNTLLLERRGNVLIALRAVSHAQMQSLAEASTPAQPGPWQLLKIGDSRYLVDWRRAPADADWLKALADVRL